MLDSSSVDRSVIHAIQMINTAMIECFLPLGKFLLHFFESRGIITL